MVGEARGARKIPLPQGSVSNVDTSNLTRRNPLLWDMHPGDLPTRRHIKIFKGLMQWLEPVIPTSALPS